MDSQPIEPVSARRPVTLLFTGHPGHELRVFHWLERTRPSVAVITDGSGRAHTGRLGSTATLLARTGASPLEGCVGFCSDRRAYAAMLAGDAAFFLAMVDRIERALGGSRVDVVASDALEHFNPTHDVCCLLASVLANRLASAQGSEVPHVCFPLDGHPSAANTPPRVDVRLDESTLDRKMAAALGYPELQGEVEAALHAYGRAPFARECLWDAEDPFTALERFEGVPQYERVGRERRRGGAYDEVITLHAHVRPLARALLAGKVDPLPAITRRSGLSPSMP
jgi:hypothetical protein